MAQYAKIITEEIEERYGRGWYCVGKSEHYDNTPTSLEYFGGKKMVGYRGTEGQFIVLDAYCPHMGADMALGFVEGNSLRCNFHAWRWGEDGVCDDIPYAKNIPAKACIKSWPTLERNGLVYIYYDPEDNPPVEGEEPIVLDELINDDWSDWNMEIIKINTSPRELVDNIADKAHFGPIHGSEAHDFENEYHKHIAIQRMKGISPRLSETEVLTTEATYWGPGVMVTRMSGSMDGVPVDSMLLVSNTPTTTESFDLRFAVAVKKIPGMTEEQTEEMVSGYVELTRAAFYEDVELWHTKARVDNPLLCDGDGPVNMLRKWYAQFFVDRADVPTTWDEPKIYQVTSVNPIPPQKLALQEEADALRAAEELLAKAKAKQG